MKHDLFSIEESSAARFFRREDWFAALAAFAVSTFMFFRHMSPEITLQDSGELVTGAFTFGVPHPPGYPLWAFMGWVWSNFIMPFGNPAWRIGTMNVLTGGLTVGVMTLMMTRSSRILLHTLPWAQNIGERFIHWIALAAGTSSALLFGFNRGVWLWASVAEMRVLNAFSFILIACLFFGWMTRPSRLGYLCATLLVYGLSMTNHQTVAVIIVALAAGTLALGVDEFFKRYEAGAEDARPPLFKTLMESLSVFWELLVAVLFCLSAVCVLFGWLKTGEPPSGSFQTAKENFYYFLAVVCLILGLVPLVWNSLAGKAKFKFVPPLPTPLRAPLLWGGSILCIFAVFLVITGLRLPPLTAKGGPVMIPGPMPGTSALFMMPGEFSKAVLLLFAGAAVLGAGTFFKWLKPQRAALYTSLFLAGCAFYMYMPIAGATNPPMNWAFAATKEGFLHSITRGQFAAVKMADPCSFDTFIQFRFFVTGLIGQYSLPLCLVGLVTLLVALVWLVMEFVKDFRKHLWLAGVWVAAVPVALAAVMAIRHVFIVAPVLEIIEAALKMGKTPPPPPPGAEPILYVVWALALPTLLCLMIMLWLFLRRPGRSWLVFVWTALLVCSIGLTMIINAKPTRQEQEIVIKFMAPAHGFFAMLIGYGIAVILAGVARFWKALPQAGMAVLCAACFALPLVTYQRNWDLCALEKFDFGWQFGYRMFKPGGGYEDMPRDAVLFGGTDPGRFVPTYMIFCASFVDPGNRFQSPWMMPHLTGEERLAEEERMKSFDRRDVYIITQNALADQTYMSYIRDHYDKSRPHIDNADTYKKFAPWQQWVFEKGWNWLKRGETFPQTPLRIPTPEESSQAFHQYVREVESGVRPNLGGLSLEGGRVQVTGPLAVMEINSILTKWIHDWNKDKHEFYIEESYPIQWMYPYLRPAGVIMKIEKEPLPDPRQNPQLWRDIIDKDKAYWDALVAEFTAREEFMRNEDAQKNFSKLRSAIAGVYLQRGLINDAVYAFEQAAALCPKGSEGGYRLVEIYISQRKYEEALRIMEGYLKHDKFNPNIHNSIKRIEDIVRLDQRRAELEQKINSGGAVTLDDMLELISANARLQLRENVRNLSNQLLANENLPPAAIFQLAMVLSDHQLFNVAEQCLQFYLRKQPSDTRGWIELGWCHIQSRKASEAYNAWRKAIETGRDAARQFLRKDERFEEFWKSLPPDSEFHKLIRPAGTLPDFR